MTVGDVIQVRQDTAANWQTVNPVLASGELGLETDTREFKFGDGLTAWNTLPYVLETRFSDTLTAARLYTASERDLLMSALGELAVRQWLDDMARIGESEQASGWSGEAFLVGDDRVDEANTTMPISRGAGSLTGGWAYLPPERALNRVITLDPVQLPVQSSRIFMLSDDDLDYRPINTLPTFTRATNAFLNGAEALSGTPRYPYGRNLAPSWLSSWEDGGVHRGSATTAAILTANSTDAAYHGTRSVAVTWPVGLAANSRWHPTYLSCEAGVTYTFSIYYSGATADLALDYRIDGNQGQPSAGVLEVTEVGDWRRAVATFACTVTGTYALFIYSGGVPTADRTVYFDGYQLEKADTASPWRPGGPSAVLIEEGTTNLLPAAQASALTAEYRTGALTGIHTLSAEVGTVKAYPEWGHGGSGIAKNAASAPIIDLDYLGVPQTLWLPGAAGNYASTPDDASLDITGDIDLRAEVALEDWTPGSYATLVSKWPNVSGDRSVILSVTATGALELAWTADGSTAVVATSTTTVPFADVSLGLARATLNVDNSAANDGTGVWEAKFYTWDGTQWVQLGTAVTGAATTSIFAGTAPLTAGANGGGANPLKGKVLRAQVRNGIDGTLVADFNAADFTAPGTTAVDSVGKTWTINRSGDATAEIVDRNTWAFTGSEYLELPDRDDLDYGTGSFVMAMAYATRATVRHQKSGKRPGTILRGFGFTSGSAVIEIRDSASNLAAAQESSKTAVDGVTHVLVGQTDRGAQDLTIWTDGVQRASASSSAVGSVSNDAALLLGAYQVNSQTMAGLLRWYAEFRRTLTAAEHTELANWDGTVATEPAWLRDEATLYVNADDPVQRAMYRAHNTVINLASGGTSSVLTMRPADNHAIWMEPVASPQRVQLEAKAYKTSWHTGGATRNAERLNAPVNAVSPSEGTIEVDVNILQYRFGGARIFELQRSTGLNGLLFWNSSPSGQAWQAHVTNDAGTANARTLYNIGLGVHRFVAIWDANGIRFLLDGTPFGTSIPISEMPDTFVTFGIGYSPSYNASELDSPILGIRISSRARTDAELADWRAPLTADGSTTYLLNLEGTLDPEARTTAVQYEGRLTAGGAWVPLPKEQTTDIATPGDLLQVRALATRTKQFDTGRINWMAAYASEAP